MLSRFRALLFQKWTPFTQMFVLQCILLWNFAYLKVSRLLFRFANLGFSTHRNERVPCAYSRVLNKRGVLIAGWAGSRNFTNYSQINFLASFKWYFGKSQASNKRRKGECGGWLGRVFLISSVGVGKNLKI